MRNRWSLFGAGIIVFLTWYLVAYVVTSGTIAGLLTGLAFGFAAAVGGLILGAAIGVAAHAIDLSSTHRDVLAGDARDGARVTLGKLPPIVPVARKSDDMGARAAAELAADQVPDSLPTTDPDPTPKHSGFDVADTAVNPLPESAAEAPDVSVPDRLAVECARFVAEHDTIVVARGDGVGAIDRAANPAEFGEFLALVSVLTSDGVDVSPVSVSMGLDSLPATVTFPVLGEQK